MRFRLATEADATAIARLHAQSWRSAYRGILSDEYLETRADQERLMVWQARFRADDFNQGFTAPEGTLLHTPCCRTAEPKLFVVLAEEGSRLIGFSSVFVESDATYGSLLDNLHVVPELTRQGIGRRLLSESVRELAKHSARGLFLWVIDRNHRAQNFYAKAGAQFVGSAEHDMPDGGRVIALRCYWPDPQRLIL
jgi:ribosomal protein S18 acetylase RimI-like enzyme